MFEYTIRIEGSTIWACVTDDAYYIEVNVTGIMDAVSYTHLTLPTNREV